MPGQLSADTSTDSCFCECQIDISDSDVSETDCQCDDCLEAQLEVFNAMEHIPSKQHNPQRQQINPRANSAINRPPVNHAQSLQANNRAEGQRIPYNNSQSKNGNNKDYHSTSRNSLNQSSYAATQQKIQASQSNSHEIHVHTKVRHYDPTQTQNQSRQLAEEAERDAAECGGLGRRIKSAVQGSIQPRRSYNKSPEPLQLGDSDRNASQEKPNETHNEQIGRLKEYLILTRHRTRQFLTQLKESENQKMSEKEALREKIRQNLQKLRLTAKELAKRRQQGTEENHQPNELKRKYAWNHQPLKVDPEPDKIYRSKTKAKPALNTNLDQKLPGFSDKRDELLEQKIKEKKEELKKQGEKKQCCPYDSCNNHHMRTAPDVIKKIERMIKRKAKKYALKQKKLKQQAQDAKKIIKAKLRAIDLKCAEQVRKSKKYDQIDRSEFHHSIDHFSTFSDMRHHRQEFKNREMGIQVQPIAPISANEEYFTSDKKSKAKITKKEVESNLNKKQMHPLQISSSKGIKENPKSHQISVEKNSKPANTISQKDTPQKEQPKATRLATNLEEEIRRKEQVQAQIKRKRAQLQKYGAQGSSKT